MVQEELKARLGEADLPRKQQLERARYEADLAQKRFLRVDPDHRLAADSVEADWDHTKLRALTEAHKEYERRRASTPRICRYSSRSCIPRLSQSEIFSHNWDSQK